MSKKTRREVVAAIASLFGTEVPTDEVVDAVIDAFDIEVEPADPEPGWYIHSSGSPVYLHEPDNSNTYPAPLVYRTDSTWAHRHRELLTPAIVTPLPCANEDES